MDFLKYYFFKCFPFIKWIRDYRIIKKESDELLSKKYELEQDCEININLFYKLNKLNEKELKRKETLEDKGKSVLLILTLTGTLLVGTMRILFELNEFNWIFIILFIGLFYLTISISLILSVINATLFSDLWLKDSYNIKKNTISLEQIKLEKNESISEKIIIKDIDGHKQIGELIRSIEINRVTLRRKANDLSCGLSTLTRSFILLFIFLVFTFINKSWPWVFEKLWFCIINFVGV